MPQRNLIGPKHRARRGREASASAICCYQLICEGGCVRMRAAQSGAHMRTSFEGEKRGRTRMHSERHVGEVPCFLGKRFDQPDGHLSSQTDAFVVLTSQTDTSALFCALLRFGAFSMKVRSKEGPEHRNATIVPLRSAPGVLLPAGWRCRII